MQMRQRDVAALDAKYAKVVMLNENDALRDDDVAAGRRRLHQSSHQVSAAVPPPPAWITASRLADTAEQDYFTLRRLITMQKQLEGTQKYINKSQCR